MDQQTIHDFKRAFLNIFVRPVNRIASLKGHNSLPSSPLKLGPSAGRIQPPFQEREVFGPVEQADRPSEQPIPLPVQRSNTGMRKFRGSVYQAGFEILIVLIFLFQMKHAQEKIILVIESDVV